ncbi:MAG: 50S ribosomal protein L11 methyltransferase [Burkholderiaceae bacterium]|jgi:ribosomal protein L11 methyltransferase|nr:50S ribosomal protein L11 methyltransferase [Burkholderiaceae bacterium]HMN65921.1 50S ribosomal protein L11 methyltransferase [Burkholderiaceae bacterium]
MWSEIVFVVERDAVEAWSDALLEAGAASVQAEDADAESVDEAPIFGEPGEPAPAGGWLRTRLAALVDAGTDAPALLERAGAICARKPPVRFELREVPDQDWVQATQSQFAPIPVGRRLWITPSWHLPDQGAAPQAARSIDGRHAIVLDPGLAFGTGSHPTTRLCLEWLDEHLRGGERVIDYGCGSGILAIAAARLGATSVCAIDIDAQALDSARRNAAVNAVTLDTRATTDPRPAPADVVVANILANPLRILAPLLSGLVAPGGHLVLAGLLDRQAAGIAQCYPAIALEAWRSLDGWTCLAGVRRS